MVRCHVPDEEGIGDDGRRIAIVDGPAEQAGVPLEARVGNRWHARTQLMAVVDGSTIRGSRPGLISQLHVSEIIQSAESVCQQVPATSG